MDDDHPAVMFLIVEKFWPIFIYIFSCQSSLSLQHIITDYESVLTFPSSNYRIYAYNKLCVQEKLNNIRCNFEEFYFSEFTFCKIHFSAGP